MAHTCHFLLVGNAGILTHLKPNKRNGAVLITRKYKTLKWNT